MYRYFWRGKNCEHQNEKVDMHSKTINKKDFSFFTGWKKENVDRHITFDISFKNDEIQVTNLSNSNLVIKNQSGYGITMGGHIKDFLIHKKNKILEIRTPYAAHLFLYGPIITAA